MESTTCSSKMMPKIAWCGEAGTTPSFDTVRRISPSRTHLRPSTQSRGARRTRLARSCGTRRWYDTNGLHCQLKAEHQKCGSAHQKGAFANWGNARIRALPPADSRTKHSRTGAGTDLHAKNQADSRTERTDSRTKTQNPKPQRPPNPQA